LSCIAFITIHIRSIKNIKKLVCDLEKNYQRSVEFMLVRE
jgi:hypothetical protein